MLVLPPGPYRITAPGGTESVTVADLPIDGVDFPLAADASTPTLGTILTVAGNGIQGSGGDGRRATAARIQNPIGITVDAAGHLYIADNVGNRVRKVEAGAGVITTVAGRSPFDAIRGLAPFGTNGGFSGDGGAATAAEFNQPQSLAFDAVGNLYIGDTNNNRVRKVDVRGIITTAAGNGQLDPGGQAGDGGLATAARVRPVGVAVDAAGNLYLAEPRFGRVRKVDPSGIISTVAGGGTAAFTEGAAATSVALVAPRTLAVDGAGNLYISDDGLNRLLKLSPAGVLTTVAGTGKAGFSGDAGPAAQAELNFPVGVAVDRAGAIYFADRNNHRVRKVSADGVIATVVGSGPFGPGSVGSFAGDNGPAMEARLWGPLQVAIDGAGNLYVADNLNRRIRKVIGIAAPGLVGGQ